MDASEFRRLEELFHRLTPLDPDEQRALLDHECADEPALRQRVEALLAADTTEPRAEAVVEQSVGWLAEEALPERVGPYRVLEALGRGGFSTVYLAQRDDGHFTMRVAIKLVHRHLRRDDVLRRLRRERQILARLDHPNIARILDGGSTGDAVPYVVMEAIDGVPVDRYCADQGLDLRARLVLFRQICDAVDYAHRNLVLHRDLKPSNILVTAEGVPKLLDFGIAKLLEGGNTAAVELDLSATLTQEGARVLTPEYASPEQVLGQPLTTASDVYSLGVVLYRLVAETSPYRFEKNRWAEVERVVTEVEPVPPSQHRAERRRGLDDLDAIVLTALDKDPERRYATVGRFAEDLGRFLEGRPVEARPASRVERLRKLVARHRRLVATAVVVLTLLSTAAGMTLWQADQARQARRTAELGQSQAEGVADFLETLFETTDPFGSAGRTVSAREVVEQAAVRIRRELGDDPELEAELLATMGRVYANLALYDEGERLLRLALDQHRDQLGPRHPRTAKTLLDLGTLYRDRGACAPARSTLRWAHGIVLEQPGEPELHASVLHRLGQVEMQCGALDRAETLLDEAHRRRRQDLGDGAEATLDTQSLLGELWTHRGRYDLAETVFSEVLEQRRQVLDPGHPNLAISLSDLGVVRVANGRPTEAIPLYEEALERLRQRMGQRHDLVSQTLYNLAEAQSAAGDPDAARTTIEETLDHLDTLFDGEHPIAADCHHFLGELESRLGNREVAEEHLRRALDLRRRLLDASSPRIAQTLFILARLVASGDPERGLGLYHEVLTLQEQTLGGDDFRLSYPLIKIGEIHRQRGDAEAALPHFQRALTLRQRGLPVGHWETAITEAYLGQCLIDLERFDEAETVLVASHEHLLAAVGADDSRTRLAVRRLAYLARRRGER